MGAERAAAITSMEAMGFERSQIEAAMRAAFNNPDRAVEYLLTVSVFSASSLDIFNATNTFTRASPTTSSRSSRLAKPPLPLPLLPRLLHLKRHRPAATRRAEASTCLISPLRPAVLVDPVAAAAAMLLLPLLALIWEIWISCAPTLNSNSFAKLYNSSPRCWNLSYNSSVPETLS